MISQKLQGRSENNRRNFIKNAAVLTALAGMGIYLPKASGKQETGGEVTPAEDLMREHGILIRISIIYDTCRLHLVNNEQFDFSALGNSAHIIRTFIEDYHEKLEENYLFPRFEKANQLTDLVKTLRTQHDAGRKITDQILKISEKKPAADKNDNQKLIKLIYDFNRMYLPHAAREDTVLFPAIKKIVSKNEYSELGDNFEDKEHELFGEDGFEGMVVKVAEIEKTLHINELSAFTPAT